MLVLVPVLLAACGGTAAHVIGPGVPPTAAQPNGVTTTASAPPTAPTTPTTLATPPSINPQSLTQIDQELNNLDNILNQANNDLSNPNPSDR
jgi:hypothetical protein